MTRQFQAGTRDTSGVAIDRQNADVGNIDSNPVTGNSYFDVTDPTFSEPLALFDWEEVSGGSGSLVYMYQLNDVRGATEPLIIPYYRDDSCFDDGTGDNPSVRLYPGDSYSELANNYNDPTKPNYDPAAAQYTQRPCYGDPKYSDPSNGITYSLTGPWRQGCIACHGIHYLFTSDTDNATAPKPTTEVDGQQYVWAVPTNTASNVGDAYANTVKFAVVPTVNPQSVSSVQRSTTLTNTSPASGEIGDTVTLSAHLADDGGNAVPGKQIDFSIDSQKVGSGLTDQNGDASVQVTVAGPARQAQLTESFAGDLADTGSSATASYQVQLDATKLALTTPKAKGGTQLTATLTDADTGDGVSGKTIAFSVNGTQVGTGSTNQNGVASIVVKTLRRTDRPGASFASDGTYGPSSA